MAQARRAYTTTGGTAYWSTIEDFLQSPAAAKLRGQVQLIFTSPPFPLNRKKAYGNLQGDQYKSWVAGLIKEMLELLADDGSIVVEIGNAWVPQSPEMSTLPIETLLEIKRSAGLALCQQFVVHNPARLPSPVQWVNVDRTRVKDTFTQVWWLSPTNRPQADNRSVLVEYSDSMKKLLRRGSYNPGERPSGHHIGEESFLNDNGGAIPPNVIEASNTSATASYHNFCRQANLPIHPARMQPEVAEFFVKFLTKEGQLVFDPFAGSNTTGWAAESNNRAWVGVEHDLDYLRGSTSRFERPRWWLRSEPLTERAS